MDYKVVVKLLVPEIEKSYELYIPINRTVRDVCKLINDMVNDDTSGLYPIRQDAVLCNRYGAVFYSYETYIRDTDIRNGSELVFF